VLPTLRDDFLRSNKNLETLPLPEKRNPLTRSSYIKLNTGNMKIIYKSRQNLSTTADEK
jgi:hypothetical protein